MGHEAGIPNHIRIHGMDIGTGDLMHICLQGLEPVKPQCLCRAGHEYIHLLGSRVDRLGRLTQLARPMREAKWDGDPAEDCWQLLFILLSNSFGICRSQVHMSDSVFCHRHRWKAFGTNILAFLR